MKNKIAIVLASIVLSACSFTGELSTTKPTTDKKDVASSSKPVKLKDLPAKKVQINSGTDIVISEGEKGQSLTASVTYEDNSIDGNVKWSSSDGTIAAVNSESGSISGVKEGTTTIIATSLKDENQRASIRVTVKKAVVDELKTTITLGGQKVSQVKVKVDETQTLQAVIKLSDGTESPNVVWNSSDSTVVNVRNGVISGLKKGSATVTASAKGDSTKQASVVVMVEDESSAQTVAPATVATVAPSPVATATPAPAVTASPKA